MIYTISKVQKSFGHKLIGNKRVKQIVCQTLLMLPEEIIKKITKTCWVISSFDDGWAFVVRGDEFKKGESIIFLSDELFQAGMGQIRYTIVHEIGHVMLNHRNSIGRLQSKSEIKKQEKEADEFVKKYLMNSDY